MTHANRYNGSCGRGCSSSGTGSKGACAVQRWEYLWLSVGGVGPKGPFGGQRTGWRSSDNREWEAAEE